MTKHTISFVKKEKVDFVVTRIIVAVYLKEEIARMVKQTRNKVSLKKENKIADRVNSKYNLP